MNKNTTRLDGDVQQYFFIRQNKPAEPSVQLSFQMKRKNSDPSSTLHFSRYPIPAYPDNLVRLNDFID